MDFIGTDSTQTVVVRAEGAPVMERMRALVNAASVRSRVSCEMCGAAGEKRNLSARPGIAGLCSGVRELR